MSDETSELDQLMERINEQEKTVLAKIEEIKNRQIGLEHNFKLLVDKLKEYAGA